MKEYIDPFFDRLRDLIEAIHERQGIVIYLGGILSKNLITSQLILDNTLNVDASTNTDPAHLVDYYLIKLCSMESETVDNGFQSASVVSTAIPDKYSITSFKLPPDEKERNGLQGRWCIENSYRIDGLVDWVK